MQTLPSSRRIAWLSYETPSLTILHYLKILNWTSIILRQYSLPSLPFRNRLSHTRHSAVQIHISAVMASRSFMPLRRSLGQLSARNTRLNTRHAGQSLRRYATEQGPPKKQQFTVWRPYLRLAVGIPFISALIYSMVGRHSFCASRVHQLTLY